MRPFLLILNGKAVADFKSRGSALKAFDNRMINADPDEDLIELVNCETGEIILSNEN